MVPVISVQISGNLGMSLHSQNCVSLTGSGNACSSWKYLPDELVLDDRSRRIVLYEKHKT